MVTESILSPIRPNNLLADEVVTQLRQAIIEGKLAPGEHLPEDTIARQLGVSRSPVRDALRALEREGLVVGFPNRGSFVREFSPHDVDEIFSLRVAIESLAAEWAIEHLTEEDLREMERLVDLQAQALAGDMACLNEINASFGTAHQELPILVSPGSVGSASLLLNNAFHEYICRRAGHSRLMEIWEGIRSQYLALFHRRLRTFPDYVLQTVPTDHRRFLQAFRERDLAQVLALHQEVNQRVVRELKEVLAEAEQ